MRGAEIGSEEMLCVKCFVSVTLVLLSKQTAKKLAHPGGVFNS